jgi:hypothetical protein
MDESFGRKRPLPILSRENHQQWFQLAMMHFQAEDTEYVLTTTAKEFIMVKQFDDTPSSKIVNVERHTK